jgi:hypothetical protein
MFSAAYSIASKFTLPIIISQRHVSGICSSGIGSFVIINREGWYVTAFHIIEQINRLYAAQNQYTTLLSQRQAIETALRIFKQRKKEN